MHTWEGEKPQPCPDTYVAIWINHRVELIQTAPAVDLCTIISCVSVIEKQRESSTMFRREENCWRSLYAS